MKNDDQTRNELEQEIIQLKQKLDDSIRAENLLKAENYILRKSEEKFSKVFQSSPDWIVISTLETGRFVHVNRAFLNITGFLENEVIGQTANNLKIWVNPHEREEMVASLNKTGVITDHEVNFRMKSGTIRTMLRSAEVIDLDGEKCIISVTHDITERKNAEMKLEIFAEELKRQNQELEQFAYIVSHDLQSPLVTLGGYLRLFKRRYGTTLEDKASEILQSSIQRTDRMQLLVKSLLGYACIGGKKEQFELVDIATLLAQTLEDLRGIIDQTDAQIISGDLPRLSVDPVQFSQVLQNLLNNSIKFSTPSPKIEIHATHDKDVWVFSVKDNGVGIPKDQSDQIFDIFQHSSSGDKGGSGIGLAVCKKIIEYHGGKIWVESQQGKGATFYFTVPG